MGKDALSASDDVDTPVDKDTWQCSPCIISPSAAYVLAST